jgi:hypothetical protein
MAKHRAHPALPGAQDHDAERDRGKAQRLPPQELHETGPAGARQHHRSLYLLDNIDSPALRRNVQRALNRGEAYHQLRRAIAYAHGGRYRVHSQHEQEIWNECSRLVGNAMGCYNALILSQALAELEGRDERLSARVLKHVSPVAWQHINFYGRYQLDADFTSIDFAWLRQQLSSEEVSRLYANADR